MVNGKAASRQFRRSGPRRTASIESGDYDMRKPAGWCLRKAAPATAY